MARLTHNKFIIEDLRQFGFHLDKHQITDNPMEGNKTVTFYSNDVRNDVVFGIQYKTLRYSRNENINFEIPPFFYIHGHDITFEKEIHSVEEALEFIKEHNDVLGFSDDSMEVGDIKESILLSMGFLESNHKEDTFRYTYKNSVVELSLINNQWFTSGGDEVKTISEVVGIIGGVYYRNGQADKMDEIKNSLGL